MNRFGKEIRKLRHDADLTQQALAEMCGVTKSYISHLENGTSDYPPSVEVLARLADELDVELARLELLSGRLPIEIVDSVIEQMLALDCPVGEIVVRVDRKEGVRCDDQKSD